MEVPETLKEAARELARKKGFAGMSPDAVVRGGTRVFGAATRYGARVFKPKVDSPYWMAFLPEAAAEAGDPNIKLYTAHLT